MIWKITLPSNETYTLPIPPRNYDQLVTLVQRRYNLKTSGSFCLKYIDSDHEFISLSSNEDLETAVLSANTDKLRTLQIFALPLIPVQQDQKFSPLPVVNEIPEIEQYAADRKRRWTAYSRPTPIKPVEKQQARVAAAQHASNEKKASRSSPALKRKRSLSCPLRKGEKLLDDNQPQNLARKQLDFLSNIAADKLEKKVQKEIKQVVPEIIGALQDILKPSPLITLSNTLATKVNKQQPQNKDTGLNRRASAAKPLATAVNADNLEGGFSDIVGFRTRPRAYTNIENRTKLFEPLKNITKTASIYQKPIANPATGYLAVCRNPLIKPAECFECSLQQAAPEENIEAEPQKSYRVSFQVKNCGTSKWPDDIRLVCINGINSGNEKMLPSLEPGRAMTTELCLQAPKESGKYLSQWRISYGRGKNQRSFGESVFEEVHVRSVEDTSPNQSAKKERRQSPSSELGRQAQDHPENEVTPAENKTPGGGLHSWNLKTSGAGNNKLASHEDRVKCARFLNEVFPGSFEEKMSFVNHFLKEATIFDAVERYLVISGGAKY